MAEEMKTTPAPEEQRLEVLTVEEQLILEHEGRGDPGWCEAEAVTCAGVCWTPSIGQTPGWPGVSGCSSWRILEADVPERSCLSPAACSRLLRLAETLGCPPPERIEYLLLEQGGRYQSSTPFKATVCGGRPVSARARQKALGNFIALPCAEYIMAGIREELEGGKGDSDI